MATTEKVSVLRLQSDTWLCVRVLRVFLLLFLSVIVFMVPLTFSFFPPLSLHLFFSPAVLIVSGTGKRERMNWSTCMSLLYFSAALVTHVLSSLLHSLLHGAKNPSADGPWNTNALHLQRVTLNLCFHKLKFVLSKKKRSKYLKEEFYKVKRSTGLNLKWNSRQHAT